MQTDIKIARGMAYGRFTNDMRYISKYSSPLGEITLVSDGKCLIGLWLVGQKQADRSGEKCIYEDVPATEAAKRWLDIYFSGDIPDFVPPIRFIGSEFQLEVWNILRDIPYGSTVTYGDIARLIAEKRGVRRMSAQAVGGAVGKNPISIIVPCHRVVGAGGKLTGYAGGLRLKAKLLKLEGVEYAE